MPRNTDAQNPSSSSNIERAADRSNASNVLAPVSNDAQVLGRETNTDTTLPVHPDNSVSGGMS